MIKEEESVERKLKFIIGNKTNQSSFFLVLNKKLYFFYISSNYSYVILC